jgi:pyruvate dehydrogenase E2 component (dihydrolipoamide acetyltransferase)
MSIEVKLPDLGDGIESGDVLEILVKVGDQITVEQSIIELETDKATVEVPSPQAGKVSKVHVSPGESIPIGGLLLSLEAVQTGAPTADPPSRAETASSASAATPDNSASTSEPEPAVPPSQSLQPTSPDFASGDDISPAGPAIRRFAREVGVDLDHVRGTGEGGRITREDVLEVVRQTNQTIQSQTPAVAANGTVDTEEHDTWGPVRYVRLTNIRKTIARKMHESWSTIPRVTNFDDADVTQLEEMRQSAKNDHAQVGIKLTTMPFVVKAAAMALKAHPEINASLDLDNERIVYKEYVNVGIAVDTDRGLVVPSLRNADRQAVPDLARSLAELATKCRTGNFTVEDLRGSTFTISNLGAIGGSYSTPIINPPEVAILLVGRARQMPVVSGDSQIQIRLMMPLSLSYDHRLVDGAIAARFLNEVIEYLESPSRTLLAP